MKVNQRQNFSDVARAIIDSNMYMVLGTADNSGHPWVSPVYFASAEYKQFYWVSSPDVRHSRNIAVRPQVNIVVFSSQAPIGTGQGVYMSAIAEQPSGVELKQGIEIFSRTSLGHGGHEWKLEDVEAPTPYRLYRAAALEHWILDPASGPDRRMEVII